LSVSFLDKLNASEILHKSMRGIHLPIVGFSDVSVPVYIYFSDTF
jgi:hypothetical protein